LCLTECLSLHEYLLYFTTLQCEDNHNNDDDHDNSDKTVCRNFSIACSANVDFNVYIIQERDPFTRILKLIVMISLNTHLMASQDRICVQCVTNGLQQKDI